MENYNKLPPDKKAIVDELNALTEKRRTINNRLSRLSRQLRELAREEGEAIATKRAGTIPANDVFDLMDKGDVTETKYFNLRVNLDSMKLAVFNRQRECVCCGLKPSYFAVECCIHSKKRKGHYNEKYFYLELYGVKDGKEVLFTQDHIRPKSKGGSTSMANLQTMCSHCNMIKSDKYDEPCTDKALARS